MKRQLDAVMAMLGAMLLVEAAIGLRPNPARPGAAPAQPRAATGDAAAPGRGAQEPSQIPARGWWQIAKRVVSGINDHRIMTEAAGITFYTLLAIFPAIAALVSLYGLVADPKSIGGELAGLQSVVPSGGMDIIKEQVARLASNSGGALGFGAIIGLLASLWSSNQGTKALFDALNIVYGEKEKRGFLFRTAETLGFTIGGIVFLILAMTGVVVLPAVLAFVGLGGVTELLLRLVRWPVLLLFVAVLLAGIYRFGPSREHAKWRWVTWGGAFAALVWVAASIGFSWYVSSFGSYNKTYGSLGAAIGFMTWIWISATVVLAGAELDAEMERQTAADTTVGPAKPIGTRGATKADQVA